MVAIRAPTRSTSRTQSRTQSRTGVMIQSENRFRLVEHSVRHHDCRTKLFFYNGWQKFDSANHCSLTGPLYAPESEIESGFKGREVIMGRGSRSLTAPSKRGSGTSTPREVASSRALSMVSSELDRAFSSAHSTKCSRKRDGGGFA